MTPPHPRKFTWGQTWYFDPKIFWREIFPVHKSVDSTSKIIKIVATGCQILRLKCTKFDFSWGSAPDPAREAYSAPPDPVAGFRGPHYFDAPAKR